MRYKIIHKLPGRLRISLIAPKGFCISLDSIRKFDGVSVSLNEKTGRLLIKHKKTTDIKEILKAIDDIPLSFTSKRGHKGQELPELSEKKWAAIMAGVRLLVSPLFSTPYRVAITLYGVAPFLIKAMKTLYKSRFNVDVLDGVALFVAIWIGDFKTAGIISFLLRLGSYLDVWAKGESKKLLFQAFYRGDDYVWIRYDGNDLRIKTSAVKEGDLVVVRTGNLIPVDGVVIEGEAMVNQASMTGEFLPVLKKPGLMVYAGTAVEEGMLVVKATRIGNETRVAKIVKIINESETLKADLQSYAERLADKIAPYPLILSVLVYYLTQSPLKAVTILLVDFSCPIKLSTPLAFVAAIIRLVRQGSLIKGGKFIEKLSKVDAFVLDKTGTLTEASPNVVDVLTFNNYEKDYILQQTACVEEHFPHPIATAIVKKAKEKGLIHKEDHGEVEYIAAHGISSFIKGKRIIVGSKHFIEEDEGIDTDVALSAIRDIEDAGYSLLYIAIDGKLAGVIVIDDPLKEESFEFVKALKKMGIKRILLITGDSHRVAKKIATELGIDEYYSEILPDIKAEIIKDLKKRGYTVAMVGDGMNDSPALSYADVGISLHHGAGIAKETSDVLLMNNSLISIINSIETSNKAMTVIKTNFKYIVGINTFLILLGITGISTPAFSALMHNATTILSAFNSLKILKRR